jgi:hypothetical protein
MREDALGLRFLSCGVLYLGSDYLGVSAGLRRFEAYGRRAGIFANTPLFAFPVLMKQSSISRRRVQEVDKSQGALCCCLRPFSSHSMSSNSHEQSATYAKLFGITDNGMSSPLCPPFPIMISASSCRVSSSAIRAFALWLAWSSRKSWHTPYTSASFVRGCALCRNWEERQKPVLKRRSVD